MENSAFDPAQCERTLQGETGAIKQHSPSTHPLPSQGITELETRVGFKNS